MRIRCGACGDGIAPVYGSGPEHRMSCRPPKVACGSVRRRTLEAFDAAKDLEREERGW